MAKQSLGARKRDIIEGIIREPVLCAYTRGGWEHFVAEVWTATRRMFVNWKTGVVTDVRDVTQQDDGTLVCEPRR